MFDKSTAAQIPTKATGKIGQNYFAQNEEQGPALQTIKLKLKHQDLEQRGYIINEKQNQVMELDIPVYELFQLPNPNYRKIFIPQNLIPVVGYNFSDEYNENLFIDEEESKLAQLGLEKDRNRMHRKNFLLQQLNKKIVNDQRKPDNYQMDREPISRTVQHKGLKQHNISVGSPTKSHSQKKEVHFQHQPEKIKLPPLPKQVANAPTKTNWRNQSGNLRAAMKQNKP